MQYSLVQNNVILPTTQTFSIDGGEIDDHLLEDVIFYAQISKNRKSIKVISSSAGHYVTDKMTQMALDYFYELAENGYHVNTDSGEAQILAE